MKIFIGCSTNDKIGKSFKQTSEKLLKEILVDNDLVFGACESGIMGIAYNIAIANNKSVTGVCLDKYKDDFENLNCNHEFTTKDIATRVNTFVEESDVLLFLPGGYETLCEFFYMIEQKRAGEFNKPIILYNDSESLYYSTLTGFFSEMKEFGFSTEKEESYFKVMSTPKEVVKFLKDYKKEKAKIALEKEKTIQEQKMIRNVEIHDNSDYIMNNLDKFEFGTFGPYKTMTEEEKNNPHYKALRKSVKMLLK